jgi:hypothetical protein
MRFTVRVPSVLVQGFLLANLSVGGKHTHKTPHGTRPTLALFFVPSIFGGKIAVFPTTSLI